MSLKVMRARVILCHPPPYPIRISRAQLKKEAEEEFQAAKKQAILKASKEIEQVAPSRRLLSASQLARASQGQRRAAWILAVTAAVACRRRQPRKRPRGRSA